MRSVIIDTLMEIWRGKVSYLIFIFFIIGLSHTFGVVHNAKVFFLKEGYSNKGDFFVILAFLVISFIWKTFILIFISSFTFSKFSYLKKISFIFNPINKNKFLLLRFFTVFILSICLFFIWNIISFLLFLLFEKIKIEHFLFYAIFEDFLITLGTPVSLYFGFYFSPLGLSFLMFIFYFFSSSELFLTPHIYINFPFYIKNLLKIMPNFMSLVSYFPFKYMKVPQNSIDITPNFYDFYFFLILSISFFIFSFKKINKLECDVF